MKTSNKLLLSLLIVALIAVTAFMGTARHYHQKVSASAVTGDGKLSTEARNVVDFTGIKVKDRITVRLTQGQDKKVEVNASSNIIPLITTEVKDGILTIETNNRLNKDEKVEVNITAPALQTLDASEGARIETTNMFTGDKLTINSNSGSHGRLNLQYQNLECEISTGAEFDLDGNITEANLTASTGANLSAGDLVTENCIVKANTGATATVHASKVLTADINTGSVLSYRGDPAKTNINSSTGGTVRKR